MVELSLERMEQMLHEETVKKEDADTILRCVYNRYRNIYEKYFADIDALDDDKIAEFKKYNEETVSLVKYYYMDIPHDVCIGMSEFEEKYSDKLLGAGWHEYLFSNFEEFKKTNRSWTKSEEDYKAEFEKQALDYFYDAMDYVFRDGFGTHSETASNFVNGITGLLFGKK